MTLGISCRCIIADYFSLAGIWLLQFGLTNYSLPIFYTCYAPATGLAGFFVPEKYILLNCCIAM